MLEILPRPENHTDDAESPADRIARELLDPLATEALKADPKAFVLGKKDRRKQR